MFHDVHEPVPLNPPEKRPRNSPRLQKTTDLLQFVSFDTQFDLHVSSVLLSLKSLKKKW